MQDSRITPCSFKGNRHLRWEIRFKWVMYRAVGHVSEYGEVAIGPVCPSMHTAQRPGGLLGQYIRGMGKTRGGELCFLVICLLS